MDYPLHTTGDIYIEDGRVTVGVIEKFAAQLTEKTRLFVWVHVYSEEVFGRLARVAIGEGYHVLPGPPAYFLVACRSSVGYAARTKMIRLIADGCNTFDDIRWMGSMFGYPARDIEWYVGSTNL